MNTPILFIVFNRPETTRKVFEIIKKVSPSKLYVAADAPRSNKPDDVLKCELTRKIVQNVDWQCDIKYLFQENNLGCSLGPRSAFDWFFEYEEEGIILEDDCLPNESFFYFCREMLIKYRNDSNIVAISGSNLGYKLEANLSYTFSRILNMWGWATWRRSAAIIDYKLNEWKDVKNKTWWCYQHLKQNIFDTDINWYKYWVDKFDKTINTENITWWDWQWIYYQIAEKKLSIIPKVNLVTNIGFNELGTHTHDSTNPAANLPTFELKFPLQHPQSKIADLEYEENILKWVLFYHKRLPWHFYMKHFVKDTLNKFF